MSLTYESEDDPHPDQLKRDPSLKDKDRMEIQEEIEKFLSRGGRIDVYPTGQINWQRIYGRNENSITRAKDDRRTDKET